MTQYKKKLIEVALPLEAINKESAREKSIRHGHPSTLHLWWARRPLAACRAVLFSSLVDDPSSHPDKFPTEKEQEKERQRLFRIIEELVKWENTNNEDVLEMAREEIRKSTDGNPPPVLDPFCGGGSIPLEAQRLGLEAHASDLNPVAVLITKALIEIPPKFAGRKPVHPGQKKTLLETEWKGAQGLAEDVRYYGQWMRDEAFKRIGHLYPKVKLPEDQGGGEATVIAWLWARTVKCPNPACGAQMPLVSSFWLSKKKGKKVWIEPIIDKRKKEISFSINTGTGSPPEPSKIGRGAKFKCLVCDQPVEDTHIKSEGMDGRMGSQLMAIVAQADKGRIYLPPNEEHRNIAEKANPTWKPEFQLGDDKRAIWCPLYGLDTFDKLFTSRQLVALATFSDLVIEAREKVLADSIKTDLQDDKIPIVEGGSGAQAYADAVVAYLGLAISKLSNRSSSLCFWDSTRGNVQQVFARQALPMTWDYTEANPFSDSTGNFNVQITFLARVIQNSPIFEINGYAEQLDATYFSESKITPVVSTDPPYYDNIGYADLSDFFYIFQRKSLKSLFSDLFSTLLVPKSQELVAIPYRFGGNKTEAKNFFETGLSKVFENLLRIQHCDYPMTLYYAFKQSERVSDDLNGTLGKTSTGWETFLGSVIRSGFCVTGTLPIRTELITNLKKNIGALASSIVLVCRPRPHDSSMTTRKDLINSLKREIPISIKALQNANIAPVDLAQSAIGPGMAVFSSYSKVVEADGSPMTVRTALALINQALDEYLTEQESEFDADTRWALSWFDQYGMAEGPYGDAETLATAKNTSVQGVVESGILEAKKGKVRLLKRDEMSEDWDPATDKRLPVWELTQRLILALETKGERGAADLLSRVGALGEVARDLAYRLYGTCERKGWAQEALAYNSLVVAWPEIVKLSGAVKTSNQEKQIDLL